MKSERHCEWRWNRFLPVFLLLVGHNTFAQLIERPIGFPFPGYAGQTNARTMAAGDTIALPFWDDFSTSVGRPSAEWWAQGEDVFVNRTLGLQPPTLGVATFDGLTRLGAPHNSTSNFVGPADSLTSKAIDLSGIPANIRSTVFLSFFWQIKGLGEIPNQEDSLRLQFYNRDRQWVTQWVLTGGEELLSDTFEQAFIAITEPEYYHAGFRFRFQSFNKQTGPFDHWHIDYVYLNQNRSSGDSTYFDHAITTLPSSPLLGLYAVPADQFRSAAPLLSGSGSFGFYNLEPPALVQPIDYYISLVNPASNSIVTWLNQKTAMGPLPPKGLERRTTTSAPLNTADVVEALGDRDSLVLDFRVFLDTGDTLLIKQISPLGDTTYHEHIDLRSNDASSIRLTFHDYLAYDDGTAEYAAGINQSRGQLAYKVAALAPDTLTAIDMFFPRIAPFAEGQPLDVLVWKTLSNINPVLLVSQRVSIQYTDSLDKFVRYEFEAPVIVKDTFFIGYRQYTDNFVGIGLDKNNNTGDRVYYNTGNGWVQNDRTDGSLMIRPVFGKADAVPITGVDDESAPAPIIYPNPSTGLIYFPVKPENLQVSDLSGKIVLRGTAQPSSASFEADLSHLPKGLYFVHYIYRNQRHTFKLLLTN